MTKTETVICNNRNGCFDTVIIHKVLTEQSIHCVVLERKEPRIIVWTCVLGR